MQWRVVGNLAPASLGCVVAQALAEGLARHAHPGGGPVDEPPLDRAHAVNGRFRSRRRSARATGRGISATTAVEGRPACACLRSADFDASALPASRREPRDAPPRPPG
jgi:hypothetical protein